jgi:hypothetical protein
MFGKIIQFILSMWPDEKYVIYVTKPEFWLQVPSIDMFVFKIGHKNIGK